MDTTSSPNNPGENSGAPVFYIPTEVCENIIDMLYSVFPCDTPEDIATLHSCSLVCRDWRVRSQRMLFYKVRLSHGTSLHRLSVILDAGQHLRDYVHHVILTGYQLQSTASIISLFPAVFSRKLPNLEMIEVVHLVEGEKWSPDAVAQGPLKAKFLPHIPLHPGFPAFLSSFMTVSSLFLECVTFRSFREFARVLRGLSNMEHLRCNSVHWITPGASYLGAEFAKLPDWAVERNSLPSFAPNLRKLWLRDITAYGAETLISMRGPHLTQLWMTIPLSENPEEPAYSEGIDLSLCTGLQSLCLLPTPKFSIDTHARSIQDTLHSWKPKFPKPELEFSTYDRWQFTRQGFANILHHFGPITETWLQMVDEAPSPDLNKTNCSVQPALRVEMFDWEAEKAWWLDHLKTCFPTWARLHCLHCDFRTPPSIGFQWTTEEKLTEAAPQSRVEQADPGSSPIPFKDDPLLSIPDTRNKESTIGITQVM